MLLRRSHIAVAVLLSLSLFLTACGSKNNTATNPAASGGTAQSQLPQPSAASPQDTTGATGSDATCPTANTKAFAKTRFVLHTGEGFGAFHRYLYKPFRAGAFSKGSNGRIKAFVKAGLAALFIKRQVRLATENVKANPALCKLIAAPLAKIGDTISSAVTKLKGGDASGIEQVNTSISSIESGSARNGVAVKEDPNVKLNG